MTPDGDPAWVRYSLTTNTAQRAQVNFGNQEGFGENEGPLDAAVPLGAGEDAAMSTYAQGPLVRRRQGEGQTRRRLTTRPGGVGRLNPNDCDPDPHPVRNARSAR